MLSSRFSVDWRYQSFITAIMHQWMQRRPLSTDTSQSATYTFSTIQKELAKRYGERSVLAALSKKDKIARIQSTDEEPILLSDFTCVRTGGWGTFAGRRLLPRQRGSPQVSNC